MAEWRYFATRLNGDGTETMLAADLPLSGVTLTDALSGPAGHTSSINPGLQRAQTADGRPLFEPWSTAIYAEEGDSIRHGCIVTNLGISGSSLSITGAGFTAAIKSQPYIGSRFFIKTDALDIVRHIWDHWQSFPGGNLGLILDRKTMTKQLIGTDLKQGEYDTVNGPLTFESGPYKLTDYLTDDLGGAIDSLATDYPFEYAESHRWNADHSAVEHHLDFGAPRMGRRRTDIRFVAGDNVIVSPDESDEADQYVSGVLVRGAGDGPAMKRKLVLRANEKRLRRISVVTDSTLKTDDSLFKRGQAMLPALIGENDVSEVAIRDSALAPIGSWREGDEVQVLTDTEWGDSAIWVRILSTAYSPADLSEAKVSLVRADKIES